MKIFWCAESKRNADTFVIFKEAAKCLETYPQDPACEVLIADRDELKARVAQPTGTLDSLIDALAIRLNLPRETVEAIAEQAFDLAMVEAEADYKKRLETEAEDLAHELVELKDTQEFLNEVIR